MTFSCRREAAVCYFAVLLTFSWCWVAMPGETLHSFPLNKGGDCFSACGEQIKLSWRKSNQNCELK